MADGRSLHIIQRNKRPPPPRKFWDFFGTGQPRFLLTEFVKGRAIGPVDGPFNAVDSVRRGWFDRFSSVGRVRYPGHFGIPLCSIHLFERASGRPEEPGTQGNRGTQMRTDHD